ncbi:MAG: mechanosensitive ion channel, partial [Chloroflexota bacterium]|nr:mechanosensitive ion channel [Chloroflexota bacterium]
MLEYGFDFDLAVLLAGALKVLLIIVVALVVLAMLRRVIPRLVTSRIHRVREESPEELAKRINTLSGVLIQVMTFIIWIVAFVMILGVLGVDTTPIIASLGVASLAVGLAAQNIIRDWLHGFFIIMEDWYRIDEVVTIAGISGLVVGFNLRRTTLRDLDGTMHIIPNNKVELASNRSREWARINLNVAVAYKENLSLVWQLVDTICQDFKNDPTWGQHMISVPK